MRPGVLLLVVVCICLGAAASSTAGPTSTAACGAGSVAAVVGGKHVCLRAGQRCKAKFAKQYRRYGFDCRGGRLVKRRPPVPLTPVTFTLEPVNGSAVTGTATLTPLDAETTRVQVHIDNPPAPSLPAHLHLGTCAKGGGIYDGLSSVVNGDSSTDVGPISTYRRGAFNIEVHTPDFTVIACGDIPRV